MKVDFSMANGHPFDRPIIVSGHISSQHFLVNFNYENTTLNPALCPLRYFVDKSGAIGHRNTRLISMRVIKSGNEVNHKPEL